MASNKSHNVRSYPFLTKTQLTAMIAKDDEFVVQCLGILLDRQTDHEVESKSTVNKNRRGFMSSHAVRGTTLGVKARGEGLTAEETADARVIVSRYSRQLAAHFRSEMIAADPSLAEAARVFSAS